MKTDVRSVGDAQNQVGLHNMPLRQGFAGVGV